VPNGCYSLRSSHSDRSGIENHYPSKKPPKNDYRQVILLFIARKLSFECVSAAATPIEHFVGNFLANFQRSLS
jgi:hypothetical protein